MSSRDYETVETVEEILTHVVIGHEIYVETRAPSVGRTIKIENDELVYEKGPRHRKTGEDALDTIRDIVGSYSVSEFRVLEGHPELESGSRLPLDKIV